MNKSEDITTSIKFETEEVQKYKDILTTTKHQLLDNVLREKIRQNEQEINTWTSYKNRHKKVIEGLQEFPLSVSENCMVPISRLAFMRGKLIHTNEILACLGDGYFAKYSASQAIALCNRRISIADDMLKRLEDERNLYEMRLLLPAEHLFGERDKTDIFEHWNEEKFDEWKIKHRQREKEYHEKMAELRAREKTEICTEEDLFKRLDELELEEELEDEMCRLEAERKRFYGDDLDEGEVYDESEEDSSDSDQITIEMLQDELKKLKNIQANKAMDNSLNISQHPDTIQDEILNKNSTKSERTISFVQKELKESCPIEAENTPESTNIRQKKRVSFIEPRDENNADKPLTFEVPCSLEQDNKYNDENNDCIRIEFSHSSNVPNIPKSDNMEIQSPVDIYKTFSIPIKPILKRTPNDIFPNQEVPLSHEYSSTDSDDECYVKSTYSSVVKDIQEKDTTASLNNVIKKNKKTVSRFKMERVKNTK